jgi:hypothetical protein
MLSKRSKNSETTSKKLKITSSKKFENIRTDDKFIDSLCSKINPEVVLKCINFSGNFCEYKTLIELMEVSFHLILIRYSYKMSETTGIQF